MLRRIRSPSRVWMGATSGILPSAGGTTKPGPSGKERPRAGALRNGALRVTEEPEKNRREQNRNGDQYPAGKPVDGKKTHYGSDKQQTDRIPITITNHAVPQGVIIRARSCVQSRSGTASAAHLL